MPEGRKRAHDGDALGGVNDLIDALAEATASTRTLKRRIVVLESEQQKRSFCAMDALSSPLGVRNFA